VDLPYFSLVERQTRSFKRCFSGKMTWTRTWSILWLSPTSHPGRLLSVSVSSHSTHVAYIDTTANPNEAWYLDIDYVNIKTAPFGSDMFNTRIDDTSPDCVYQGNWAEGPSAYQDRYYNTTAHFSNSRDSSVTCRYVRIEGIVANLKLQWVVGADAWRTLSGPWQLLRQVSR
jgi:hypothetical protein